MWADCLSWPAPLARSLPLPTSFSSHRTQAVPGWAAALPGLLEDWRSCLMALAITHAESWSHEVPPSMPLMSTQHPGVGKNTPVQPCSLVRVSLSAPHPPAPSLPCWQTQLMTNVLPICLHFPLFVEARQSSCPELSVTHFSDNFCEKEADCE